MFRIATIETQGAKFTNYNRYLVFFYYFHNIIKYYASGHTIYKKATISLF